MMVPEDIVDTLGLTVDWARETGNFGLMLAALALLERIDPESAKASFQLNAPQFLAKT
jgi:hypothetical protein